ncbi:DUF3616 domain-containing protein [Bradyrhizobium sp. KBS0727]|uniref:DUF3616 domain-containing protein n=1 Tax=unclassified Bradyrhizobium TaxID=2631580 RepID=UPI00110E58BF|nr:MULTISPECIES: DUF3616 domain-containing protein [unclassified Bradyrhizobium]QDW39630.1 DUF3616 domain-containing protein [Bradyrhizobium sp. KBS0725]QDW46233.1 DUF3616 domain-containing protein [Bradyrhizobium sp. KBS0727]
MTTNSTARRYQRVVAILIGLAAAVGGGTSIAQTRVIEPVPVKWKLSDDFEKSRDARTNISGAACFTFKTCVAVNDEKKYAQFFAINGTEIRPGKVIRLIDDQASGNPDAEGAAYDNGFFYITGSHGRGRHHPEKNDDLSYLVFRFAIDTTTGAPPFHISEDKVVGVESSSRLREVIKDELPKFYDKPLDDNGANVEGIAVKDGRMYLGFRGPSVDGDAFLISVDAEAVFTAHKALDARLIPLKLGTDTGVRDLAAVSNGLLILSGPVNDQTVTPAVRLLNPATEKLGQPTELAVADKTAKAETLLILKDEAGQPWRALVMFDGPENGAPTEYLIPR